MWRLLRGLVVGLSRAPGFILDQGQNRERVVCTKCLLDQSSRDLALRDVNCRRSLSLSRRTETRTVVRNGLIVSWNTRQRQQLTHFSHLGLTARFIELCFRILFATAPSLLMPIRAFLSIAINNGRKIMEGREQVRKKPWKNIGSHPCLGCKLSTSTFTLPILPTLKRKDNWHDSWSTTIRRDALHLDGLLVSTRVGLEELVCCRPKEDRRLRDSSGVARARNRRQDHHLRAIRRLYS